MTEKEWVARQGSEWRGLEYAVESILGSRVDGPLGVAAAEYRKWRHLLLGRLEDLTATTEDYMDDIVNVTTTLRLLPDGRLRITVEGTPEELEECFSEEFQEGLEDALVAEANRGVN